jgi:hypothetical protein
VGVDLEDAARDARIFAPWTITLAIRNFYDLGNVFYIPIARATLAVFLDRLGRYEPAATIAGFRLSPLVAAGFPEITTAITHLRSVFGDQTYESLARKGETMTTAAMATYAYDQIDQARTELAPPIIGRAITLAKPYGIRPRKSLMTALVAWATSKASRKLPNV